MILVSAPALVARIRRTASNAVHDRHADIHPNQVRVPLVKQCHCFLSVGGLAQLKTKRFQEPSQQQTVLRLVFDNQEPVTGLPLGQSQNAPALRFFRLRHRRKNAHWDAEIKHRSLAWLAGNANLAAHQLDVLLADGQTQSGPGLRGSLAANCTKGRKIRWQSCWLMPGPESSTSNRTLGSFRCVTAGEPGTELYPA